MTTSSPRRSAAAAASSPSSCSESIAQSKTWVSLAMSSQSASWHEARAVGEVTMVGDVGPAVLAQQRRGALALPVGVLDNDETARLQQCVRPLNDDAHDVE